MARLLQRVGDDLIVSHYDRALRVAKKLTAVLRGELGEEDFRLHMAQRAVAAGLRCENMHAMTRAEYPRRWNGGRAVDVLDGCGFVAGRARADQAVRLVEILFAFDLDTEVREGRSASVIIAG